MEKCGYLEHMWANIGQETLSFGGLEPGGDGIITGFLLLQCLHAIQGLL